MKAFMIIIVCCMLAGCHKSIENKPAVTISTAAKSIDDNLIGAQNNFLAIEDQTKEPVTKALAVDGRSHVTQAKIGVDGVMSGVALYDENVARLNQQIAKLKDDANSTMKTICYWLYAAGVILIVAGGGVFFFLQSRETGMGLAGWGACNIAFAYFLQAWIKPFALISASVAVLFFVWYVYKYHDTLLTWGETTASTAVEKAKVKK
jgi:hypothetical protein